MPVRPNDRSSTSITASARLAPILLLAVSLLGACGGPTGERDEASSLTVMTFNIRYDNPDDGRHAWPNRRERVANLIRFYRPDLLGVQEALDGQMEDLAERLPEYEWFGRGRNAEPTDGEYSAVFYRTDRLELLEHDTFWLSLTPDEAASVGWDAALPRIVTWGRLQDRRTGNAFYHFNTHFDHRGDTARLRSAELIAGRIEALERDLPVVLTGDLNFTPRDPPYQALSAVLRDARRSAEDGHFGPDETFSGFEVDSEPGPRIDYVWTTPDVRVLRSATLTAHVHGDNPSDHRPVVAVVELPGDGSGQSIY